MPIGDELVLEVVRTRKRREAVSQFVLSKTAIQNLLPELRALPISVHDHIPRYFEGLGKCRIDTRAATLLEINYTNSVYVERPPQSLPQGMD
jgi:hypothetical protein